MRPTLPLAGQRTAAPTQSQQSGARQEPKQDAPGGEALELDEDGLLVPVLGGLEEGAVSWVRVARTERVTLPTDPTSC
jgi:hypothetical protein